MYQLLFCPFSFFLPFVQKVLSIREVALHVIMAPYDFPKNTMLRSPKGGEDIDFPSPVLWRSKWKNMEIIYLK